MVTFPHFRESSLMKNLFRNSLLFVMLGFFCTGLCAQGNELALSYRLATQKEIASLTNNSRESREEKKYIRNSLVISLEIKNAMPEEEFYLYRRDFRGVVNRIGRDTKKADGKILLILDGYFMPGEPVEIIAVTQDKKRSAFIH